MFNEIKIKNDFLVDGILIHELIKIINLKNTDSYNLYTAAVLLNERLKHEQNIQENDIKNLRNLHLNCDQE